jgi:hypothetical protein
LFQVSQDLRGLVFHGGINDDEFHVHANDSAPRSYR